MTQSIAMFTDADVAGAVRLWRSRSEANGALLATVVVKARFTLQHDRAAQPAPPEPMVLEERTFGGHPMRSVERAAELAPRLARCDLLCTGHAHAPGGRTSMSARLAVFRDRTALADKTIHVFGDRKSGGTPQSFERMPLMYERAFGGPGVEANPVGNDMPNLVDPREARRPAAFGPLSRFWPARKKQLGAIDPALFAQPVWSLPEPVPWDYFQSAPPDQQIAFPAGDEWIVLDGMHPELPRLQSRLPGATAGARLVTATGETPIELRADMLIVDADKSICTVVWRGHTPVPGDEQGLSSVAVVAGVDLPRKPIAWADLAAKAKAALAEAAKAGPARAGAAAAPSAAAAPRPAEVGESTLGLSDAQQAAQSLKAVAPFAVAAPASAPSSQSRAATPWGGPIAPTPVASASVGESTIALGGPPPAPAPPTAPSFIAAAPPAVVTPPAVSPAPAFVPSAAPAVVSPTPAVAATQTPSFMVGKTPPLAAAPVSAPALSPAPVSAPAPAPVSAPAPAPAQAPPKASRPRLASLEERLQAAGTPAGDIAALLAALSPPPPPPPEE